MDAGERTTGAALDALGRVDRAVQVFGLLSAAALLALVAVSASGGTASTPMWVRAGLLLAIAELTDRAVLSASRGSRRSFGRVKAIAVVVLVAAVGVDLIPGIWPAWYLAMQGVCTAPLIRAAVITRAPALRDAFPKPR